MKGYRLSAGAALAAGTAITAGAVMWFGSALMLCPGLAFTAMLLLGSDRILERARDSIKSQPIRIASVPIALWAL